MSHHYQFTVSYALQNLNGLTTLFNLNNWYQAYGPLTPRHSRNPVQPLATGIDLTGTNSTYTTPIDPTGQYRCFPISCGKSDLAQMVSAFNAAYAGTKTPSGNTIRAYIPPPNYEFGDPTFSQAFRLTKTFTFRERSRVAMFGEVFNAFNIANLTGYSFNLDTVNPNPATQT